MATALDILIRMRDQYSAVGARVLGLMDQMAVRASGMSQRFNSATTTMGTGLSRVESRIEGIGGPLQRIAIGLASLFAVSTISSYTGEVVRLTSEMQTLQNVIGFAGGESQRGQNLAFLADLSERYGLNLRSTTESYAQFAAATQGTIFQGAQGRKIFEQLSTGISVLGLSAENSKRAFTAFGQMMSKGYVQAEELKGQLGDALPGALGIAARAMGMSVGDLMKAMEKGAVSAEVFLPRFAAEMQRTMGPGVAAAADSLGANLNRMDNAMLNFKLRFGEAIQPLVMEALKMGIALAKGALPYMERLGHFVRDLLDPSSMLRIRIEAIGSAVKTLGISLAVSGGVLAAFSMYVGASTGFLGAFNIALGLTNVIIPALTGGIRMLSAAIFSIPVVGWVLAGITALVALFTYFWEASEDFRGGMYGIWEVTKEVVGLMGTAFKGLGLAIAGALGNNPALISTGVALIETAFSDKRKVGDVYNRGFARGAAAFRAEKGLVSDFSRLQDRMSYRMAGEDSTGLSESLGGPSLTDELSGKAAGVAGRGGITHITQNFHAPLFPAISLAIAGEQDIELLMSKLSEGIERIVTGVRSGFDEQPAF